MAINLVDLFKSQIGSEITSKAAQFLGEDSSSIQSALTAAMPAILGGVANQANSASGASNLLNMLSSGGHDGSIMNNLSSLLGGGSATQGLVSSGTNMVKGLFGDKASGIADAIAAHSGLKSSSATSLLGMAAPMVMGMLGSHVNSNGLNASGLMGLLGGQSDFIKNALPTGLRSAVGSGAIQALADKPLAAASAAASSVRAAASTAASDAASEVESSGIGKWWPWLLLVAAALLAWYLIKGCKSDAPAPTPPAAVVVDTTAKAPVPVATVVQMDTLKLPDGTSIAVKPGSFLESLYKEMADPKSSVGVKLTFDNVNFATGSSVIADDSKGQLDDLAHIMKAFPGMEIKVIGYTDNKGDAAANLKLSKDRAHAVDAYLDTKGIAANRVITDGMGDKDPVASNDTEDGRAKNRRIEATITKEK